MWALIARSFLRLATSTGRTERRAYREKAAARRSVPAALLGKELARFTASPNYMLNCGLGVLLMPAAGAALLWKGAVMEEALGGMADGGLLPVLLAAAAIFYAVNYPASVSAAATTRQLPIYSVERSQKVCAISFDAAWGDAKVRQFSC